MATTAKARHSSEETTATEDIKELLREAEEALSNVTGEAGEQVAALRERLKSALAEGRISLERLRSEARKQAQHADEVVRSHPYQAIGIAAGVGVLIGFLFSRCQR